MGRRGHGRRVKAHASAKNAEGWGTPADEIKEQILKVGIRKLERETKISHHTLERILWGEAGRRKTGAKSGNKAHHRR